jgi:hypothetical protein
MSIKIFYSPKIIGSGLGTNCAWHVNLLHESYPGPEQCSVARCWRKKFNWPDIRSTQCPTQWVLEALSSEVKRQEPKAYQSYPSRSKKKNSGAIPPVSHISSWHRAQLLKHRDNFTFYLLSRNIAGKSLGIYIFQVTTACVSCSLPDLIIRNHATCCSVCYSYISSFLPCT